MESDVCLLPNLHEPSIIANLGQRFLNGSYFTEMNGHTIFVNPHITPAKNSCDGSEMDQEPTVDNIAYYALRMMNFYGAPQVIMLKGECGSGKTFCANGIVDYFTKATLNEDPANEHNDISLRLRDAHLIFECFGCAMTAVSKDSTRMGMFTKLFFSHGVPTRATIDPYALEYQRIVRPPGGERNFNIFYEVLTAKDSSLGRYMKHLKLRKAYDYRFTAQDGAGNSTNRVRDEEKFCRLVDAMLTIGVTNDQAVAVFHVVAAILFLGNITFLESESDDGPISSVEDPDVLEIAAKALGIDVYALNTLLTEKVQEFSGQRYVVALSIAEAQCNCEMICKALYKCVFSFITQAVNANIANNMNNELDIDGQDNSALFIAISDLSGVRREEFNDFDSFMINFASESLHVNYMTHVFETDVALLRSEGVFTGSKHPRLPPMSSFNLG